MFLHIPISVQHHVSVKGRFWRVLQCRHCREQYAFVLDLEAAGTSHDFLFVGGDEATELAKKNALENLERQNKNIIIAIPCPNCGNYQDDMVTKLKEDASINPLQIIGGVLLLAAFLPLIFSQGAIAVSITTVLAMIGLIVLIRGIVQSLRFNPNAGDPEPRKKIGRSQSVHGSTLKEMLDSGAL